MYHIIIFKRMEVIRITASVDEAMSMIGYQPKTTFWMDFSIADKFGINAIQDTYNRAFEEWKNNYVYLTELVMVLNHKIWQWYETNEAFARVYNSLWEEADLYAQENLHGEELKYFYEVTD